MKGFINITYKTRNADSSDLNPVEETSVFVASIEFVVPQVFCSAHLKASHRTRIARRYLTFYDKGPQQRKIGTRKTVFFFVEKFSEW